LKKINKIDRPLANLNKMRRGKKKEISTSEIQKREITTNHRNPGYHQRLP
jgi:hypothetical protein